MSLRRTLTSLLILAIVAVAASASAQHRSRRYRGHRVYYRPSIGAYGHYYNPFYGFYYGPYYGSYAYGYPAPYVHAGHGYSGPYDYRGRSSLRLLVEPVETEVYVDGYFAGIVDDFDGYFQRLHLPPGEHEVELFLEGHESTRKTLFLSPGATYKIHHEMVPLEAGEPEPARPEPRETVEGSPPASPRRPGPAVTERTQAPPPRRSPSAFGVLALRIQPAGSVVIIDGDRWPIAEDSEELTLHLPAGRHALEIRSDGYRSFETEVEIRAERATELNVRLPRPQNDRDELGMDASAKEIER